MPFLRRPRPDPDTGGDLSALSHPQLLRRYRAVSLSVGDDAAESASRAELADRLAAEVLRRRPSSSEFWYDRGMLAKWRRDWATSRELNQRALELLPVGGREGEAAAWNLGIAATALRDWATARRAWGDFGIPLPDAPADAPIEADFGPAPVRLNAEPRFVGQEPLELDGRVWQTEVVWGRRLCPTRIRVLNVPTPESGHRFGDIVLHDGDTLGTRRLGGHDLGVFNEIALWERSPHPTLTATVEAPDEASLEELTDLFDAEGGAAEDWTSSMQVLCRACSEGSPGQAGHHHAADDGDWRPSRTVGLAADPSVAGRVLDRWASGGPGRDHGDVEVALP